MQLVMSWSPAAQGSQGSTSRNPNLAEERIMIRAEKGTKGVQMPPPTVPKPKIKPVGQNPAARPPSGTSNASKHGKQ